MSDPAPRPQHPLVQAWLVIALAAGIGTGLAVIETRLAPRIAANEDAKVTTYAPALVGLPTGTAGVGVQRRVIDGTECFRLDHHGSPAGWVIKGLGSGYAPGMVVLIGLDPAAQRILGLKVTAQTETPGLGDYVAGEAFSAQFQGRPADTAFRAVKSAPAGDDQIQARTGATISAKGVCGIVNATLTPALRQALATGGGPEGGG